MRVEIHQVEGFDLNRRSFNRNAEIIRSGKGYYAAINYEGLEVQGTIFPTIEGAMRDMITNLQAKGFFKLRSRVNFKGQRYLAEREPWIDYPDLAKVK
jgi:hypothetical protein